MGNMGSSHPFLDVNISAKFEENSSIGIIFLERTRQWRRTDRRRTDRQSASVIAPRPSHFDKG